MRVPALSLEEVDAVVTERTTGRVEVVDALGKRVPGEVDPVVLKALRAGLVCSRVGPHRFLGEEAARLLAGRGHLGAVGPRRAVAPR